MSEFVWRRNCEAIGRAFACRHRWPAAAAAALGAAFERRGTPEGAPLSVASIISVSTPHRGTPMADMALELLGGRGKLLPALHEAERALVKLPAVATPR